MASAPKSNAAYLAVDEALETVKSVPTESVPRHLQNKHADSHGMEREQGYLYAHDFKNHYVKQQYLPDSLVGTKFYRPTDIGYEQTIQEYFRRIKGEE